MRDPRTEDGGRVGAKPARARTETDREAARGSGAGGSDDAFRSEVVPEVGADRNLRPEGRREARSEEVGVICVSDTGNQYAVIYTRYDLRWVA